MADKEVEKLKQTVKLQEQQIQTLKQAILRMEQALRAVSVVSNRTQGQTRRITEEVRGIQHKLRKG